MIIANIASIPSREKMLEKTVKSLESQVDTIFVCLNNYKYIPEYLKNRPNIITHIGDNLKGDAGKFWLYCHAPTQFAQWFFCDDDILYPKDYISASLKFLDQYPNEVLTYHGKIFKKPITKYYGSKDRIKAFHCTHTVLDSELIQVPGTGVMFINSNTVNIDWDFFKYPNMADIWLYKFTQSQGVNVRVCAHNEGWIIAQDSKGIFEDNIGNDDIQVKVFNK